MLLKIKIKENLIDMMNNGNIKAIQILVEVLNKEDEADEVKLQPIFNINVSNQEDVEKLKKILR